jgi:hypothetical protein
MKLKRYFFLAVTSSFLILSFQNCGPNNGFSPLESNGSANLASTAPNDPQSSLKACDGTLAPGEECFVAIKFVPTTPGPHTGSFTVNADGKVIGEVLLSGQAE